MTKTERKGTILENAFLLSRNVTCQGRCVFEL